MNWKIKNLITLHSLIIVLICSLFLEPLKQFWIPIDTRFFHFVNSWIQDSYFWQNFWAMANHRLTDFVVEDVGFLFFFFWIIRSTPKSDRIRKAAECLFVLFYAISITLLANELLFRYLIAVYRKSPSWVIDSFVNLPDKIHWLKIKTRATKSFPGDHATTCLVSIVGFFYLARNFFYIRLVTTLFGLFLILPRLVVGAHWLTDALIGGGSIVLFFSAWAFFSPLGAFCINKIEKGLFKIQKLWSKPMQTKKASF